MNVTPEKNAIMIYTKRETTNLLSINPPEVYLFSSTEKRGAGEGCLKGDASMYKNKTEVGLSGEERGVGRKEQNIR